MQDQKKKKKSISFRHFLLLNIWTPEYWVGNLLSHSMIHLHINLCEWFHLKDSRMLEMRKNSTSKMSCIQQQSHQSQHGLKIVSKYYWKNRIKRCELVKILKLCKHDIRPCLYVFSENEVQFHFSHFSCNFLSKHYIHIAVEPL